MQTFKSNSCVIIGLKQIKVLIDGKQIKTKALLIYNILFIEQGHLIKLQQVIFYMFYDHVFSSITLKHPPLIESVPTDASVSDHRRDRRCDNQTCKQRDCVASPVINCFLNVFLPSYDELKLSKHVCGDLPDVCISI